MITFVDYQYKGIGGVGQLVVNSTLELNRRGKRTKLYCSTESYEYIRLCECKADFVFIDSDNVSLKKLNNYITHEDIIILTKVNDSPLLEAIKKKNNKLLFYSVHPDTFFGYLPQMKYFCNPRKAALNLVEVLNDHDCLYFMDWPNVKGVYDRGGKTMEKIRYLPIPVMSYSNKYRNNKPSSIFNITYIGRGNDKWKVFPVIKILEDLNKLKKEIQLTIITDSNTLFKQMINEFVLNNNIIIHFINNIYGEKLEQYLLENSTLHISMGTSALEGAKLGIPTIVIDYSKQKFPDYYLYRWLYECENYCLAGEIKDGILPYSTGRNLGDIIDLISTEEGYTKESLACRTYLNKNHSIQSFISNIEDACKITRMTSQDYCKTNFSRCKYRIEPFLISMAKVKQFVLGKKISKQ